MTIKFDQEVLETISSKSSTLFISFVIHLAMKMDSLSNRTFHHKDTVRTLASKYKVSINKINKEIAIAIEMNVIKMLDGNFYYLNPSIATKQGYLKILNYGDTKLKV